jgi:hypothetical protein
MSRTSRNVVSGAEPTIGGVSAPEDPPSSAWGIASASADEDAGFDDAVLHMADDDDWPGAWGAARLGIP